MLYQCSLLVLNPPCPTASKDHKYLCPYYVIFPQLTWVHQEAYQLHLLKPALVACWLFHYQQFHEVFCHPIGCSGAHSALKLSAHSCLFHSVRMALQESGSKEGSIK